MHALCSTTIVSLMNVRFDPELVKFHIEQHKNEDESENVQPHPVLSGSLAEGEVVRDILREYIENC